MAIFIVRAEGLSVAQAETLAERIMKMTTYSRRPNSLYFCIGEAALPEALMTTISQVFKASAAEVRAIKPQKVRLWQSGCLSLTITRKLDNLPDGPINHINMLETIFQIGELSATAGSVPNLTFIEPETRFVAGLEQALKAYGKKLSKTSWQIISGSAFDSVATAQPTSLLSRQLEAVQPIHVKETSLESKSIQPAMMSQSSNPESRDTIIISPSGKATDNIKTAMLIEAIGKKSMQPVDFLYISDKTAEMPDSIKKALSKIFNINLDAQANAIGKHGLRHASEGAQLIILPIDRTPENKACQILRAAETNIPGWREGRATKVSFVIPDQVLAGQVREMLQEKTKNGSKPVHTVMSINGLAFAADNGLVPEVGVCIIRLSAEERANIRLSSAIDLIIKNKGKNRPINILINYKAGAPTERIEAVLREHLGPLPPKPEENKIQSAECGNITLVLSQATKDTSAVDDHIETARLISGWEEGAVPVFFLDPTLEGKRALEARLESLQRTQYPSYGSVVSDPTTAIIPHTVANAHGNSNNSVLSDISLSQEHIAQGKAKGK